MMRQNFNNSQLFNLVFDVEQLPCSNLWSKKLTVNEISDDLTRP